MSFIDNDNPASALFMCDVWILIKALTDKSERSFF